MTTQTPTTTSTTYRYATALAVAYSMHKTAMQDGWAQDARAEARGELIGLYAGVSIALDTTATALGGLLYDAAGAVGSTVPSDTDALVQWVAQVTAYLTTRLA